MRQTLDWRLVKVVPQLINVHPSFCEPPHAVTHPVKANFLMRKFLNGGWDPTRPALVGYWSEDGIQLMSGSHRWAAAWDANIAMPVVVWEWHTISEAFGNLKLWEALMASGLPENRKALFNI